MTPAERDAYTARLRRALRDDEIRRGSRPPKAMREMLIWREGLHKTLLAGDEQGGASGDG
jgi:hypothetical protein